jgi:hypothetical protein
MTLLRPLLESPFPPDVFLVRDGDLRHYRFVRAERRRWRLAAARETPLPPEVWHEQPLGRSLTDPQVVAEAVEGSRRLVGGRLDRASLVVPDGWVRTFLVELEQPPAGPKETDEMILWKLKKLLPFRPEDFRYVWTPLGEERAARKFFVVGMHEKVAAGFESAFSAAGVAIGSIEAESLVLASLAGGGADPVMMISVDATSFQFVLVRSGRLALHRSKRFSVEGAEEREELLRRELELTMAFLESSGAKPPRSLRIFEESADGGLSLERAIPAALREDVRRIGLPEGFEAGSSIDPSLLGRAPLAAAVLLGRGGER